MMDTVLQERLQVMRTALEGYWAAWAEERGRPEAATGATMCRFTAAFLVLVLGWPWRVAGGDEYADDDQGGYFDGKEWHAHYWVTDGHRILDLTANQFGGPPIVLTSVGDPRYVENYEREVLEDAMPHVAARAEQWASDFSKKHCSFSVSS
jgi:hypothetical protein